MTCVLVKTHIYISGAAIVHIYAAYTTPNPIVEQPYKRRKNFSSSPSPLPHRLQEIILLNRRPPLHPHGLPQLLSRSRCIDRALQRAITSREIDRLFINRHFRLQQFRIIELLLPEPFRREPALLLRLGYDPVSPKLQNSKKDKRINEKIERMSRGVG